MKKYFVVATMPAIAAIRSNGSFYTTPHFPGSGYNRSMAGGYSEGVGPQIVNPFREGWVNNLLWKHCVEKLGESKLCVMDAQVDGLPCVEVFWNPHGGKNFEACLRLDCS